MIDQEDSFTDTLEEELVSDMYERIAFDLFDSWNESNLNEGMLYADFKMAEMSGDNDIIDAFHKHWGITPSDEYWLGD